MAVASGGARDAAAFPAAEVEASLREALVGAAKTEAELRGAAWPEDAAAQGAASVHVDSLVVVETFCAVEPLLGFELRGTIVREGGYPTVDEAVGHLMPRLEREWNRKKGKSHERSGGRGGP